MSGRTNQFAQPVLRWQFKLRTVLATMSTACLCLGFNRLLGWENSFALGSGSVLILAVWLTSRDDIRSLTLVTSCHLVIAAILLAGPIAAYQLSGYAGKDYAIAGWDPTSTMDNLDGLRAGERELRFLPSVVCTPIAAAIRLCSGASVPLTVVPPTAPIIAGSIPVLALRLRKSLSRRQKSWYWSLWLVGLLPTLYIMLCGASVVRWLAD